MRRLRPTSERGMVLPVALGILAVLSLSTVVVLDSSGSNSRSSHRSKGDKVAFALAEAGINNAVAVLSKSGNNNIDQSLLPACSRPESEWILNDGGSPALQYEGGDARWCATFDAGNAVWMLTARGIVRNPNGTMSIRRELRARVPITPIVVQPLQNMSWNYMFATRTGTPSGCDLTFVQNVIVATNVYVMGNLCLEQNAIVDAPAKVIVLGKVSIQNNGQIGQPGTNNWSTRVETQVGGAGGQFCKYSNGAWTTASSNPFCGDAQHVYSKNSTGTAMTVSPNPENISPPVPDWDGWYETAMPGPTQPCTTSSGTPPVFDNNSTRDAGTNGSVSTVFNLTPTTSSYTCFVGNASNPLGELSWDHSKKKLKVQGTIFIDGSLKMVDAGVVEYDGYASIYISGTYLMENNSKLCAVKNADGTDCDFVGWDPNNEMIVIVAGGNGSLAGAGSQTGSTSEGPNSIKLNNNVRWQGAMYATYNIELLNNAKVDGPMIGATIVASQNVIPDGFPTIEESPAGMPGNEMVYAQTEKPRLFSG